MVVRTEVGGMGGSYCLMNTVLALQNENSSEDRWWWWLCKNMDIFNANELYTWNGYNGKFYIVCILPQLKIN